MSSTDFFTPTTSATPQGSATSEGVARYLMVVGLALLALMLALEPDVGFTAPLAMRLLFWFLQIVTGLLVLQAVLVLLTRHFGASRAPSWSLVLLSGLFGAVVLAPLYWLIGEGLIEGWLGYPAGPDDESTDLIGMTLAHPLIEEYLQIVGPVTAAWALICLPRLHWLVPPVLNGHSAEPAAQPQTRWVAPIAQADLDQPCAAVSAGPALATWRERLPAELGTDVIAVASELQYLRVWTPRGCALILGALADVQLQEGAAGLRVHRSWWVAAEHVVSVRRTATAAVCLMSDGREVPVSRRRRSEVIDRFGGSARYRATSASKAAPNSNLN
jgi:hypothetical protein